MRLVTISISFYDINIMKVWYGVFASSLCEIYIIIVRFIVLSRNPKLLSRGCVWREVSSIISKINGSSEKRQMRIGESDTVIWLKRGTCANNVFILNYHHAYRHPIRLLMYNFIVNYITKNAGIHFCSSEIEALRLPLELNETEFIPTPI